MIGLAIKNDGTEFHALLTSMCACKKPHPRPPRTITPSLPGTTPPWQAAGFCGLAGDGVCQCVMSRAAPRYNSLRDPRAR